MIRKVNCKNMSDNLVELETRIYDLLGSVIDPELGRSVTELNMVTGVRVSEKSCEKSCFGFKRGA